MWKTRKKGSTSLPEAKIRLGIGESLVFFFFFFYKKAPPYNTIRLHLTGTKKHKEIIQREEGQ